MTFTLRPYQDEAVGGVSRALKSGKRAPLLVLPCRSGKTVVFSHITRAYSSVGKTVLIGAHRRELIKQIAYSLCEFGVKHRVIGPPDMIRQIMAAEFRRFGRSFVDANAKTIIGSVQTFASRLELLERETIDMMIWDESHHVTGGTQYAKVIESCKNPRMLMVTATPQRLDGKGLGVGHGGFADKLIIGPSPEYMIENGYLADYRMFSTASPIDLANVGTLAGDYNKKDLEDATDKPSIVGDTVELYKQHADGLRTVVYAVSIQHSKHIAERFNAAGVPAEHFDADTPNEEREAIVTRFAKGETLILCNVGLLGEGIDLAALAGMPVTIDCVIDCAPTQSLTKFIQATMRCLAPAPSKVAVIIDQAGNAMRHGLPTEDREWSLEGRERKSKRKDDDEPDVKVQTCLKCYAIHKPAPACPMCGTVAPVRERKGPEQKAGELIEISRDDFIRRAARIEQGKAQSIEALMAQGISRFRAAKIIEARREKAALIEEALSFADGSGVSMAAIRRMKPMQLKIFIDNRKGLAL